MIYLVGEETKLVGGHTVFPLAVPVAEPDSPPLPGETSALDAARSPVHVFKPGESPQAGRVCTHQTASCREVMSRAEVLCDASLSFGGTGESIAPGVAVRAEDTPAVTLDRTRRHQGTFVHPASNSA